MHLSIGPFSFPDSHFLLPPLPSLGPPSRKSRVLVPGTVSGEHNPSPLPCFLLIVSPLIVFVTRIPPCWEGEGKGRGQKGSDCLRWGPIVFWPLGCDGGLSLLSPSNFSNKPVRHITISPMLWMKKLSGGRENLSNQSTVIQLCGRADFKPRSLLF